MFLPSLLPTFEFLANFAQVEQAERRRLEDELRALKKAQGPGKSSLSQSYGST